MQDTAGEAGTSSELIYSYGPQHMAGQKQDDQLEHTFSNYVRIRNVALKTCQKRWTIGRCGERGSGISVLGEWDDDDDETIRVRWQYLKSFNCEQKKKLWIIQNITSKLFVYKWYIYLIYMYKEVLALNNLQCLICYKTQPN